jgi:N-acetylneuraminic acid mutarotase
VAVDGKLIVMGGESMNQVESHSAVEVYDPTTQTWLTLAPLPVGRHGTQATLLNGKLHLVAGSGNRSGGPELNDHLVMSFAE